MGWIMGIQRAVDYMEEHIEEELDYEKIAGEAFCSSYYFQKIFHILCGFSVGEYIRNRRLTLAGTALSTTNERIIDIALRYGYESPESFARAFARFHGITPSEARRDGSKLKLFSRLSVQIMMKGGNIMNYKIVEKSAFKVLQRVETHHIADSENENTIPDYWSRAKRDGTVETLLSLTSDKTNIFGICYGNAPKDDKTFEYAIAAVCDGNVKVPEGFSVREIPGRTWAVFECVGAMPDAMQETWHNICAEFFPTSGYEPTYEMDIEVYPEGDMCADNYRSEIWVPVKQ